MIRQYRIDRYQGLEFLVCEVYSKHTWTQSESDAFLAFIAEPENSGISRSDFRVLCNEWLEKPHSPSDTFYGLNSPIPAIDYIPCIVLRGAIVNNRVASLAVDSLDSVTSTEVIDNIQRFYDFVKSPHWRNTVFSQLSKYGSLFGSDND